MPSSSDDQAPGASLIRNSSFLRTAHYNNPANLQARINLHARFSTNLTGWSGWVFDRLQEALGTTAVILESGAGPGTLWINNRHRLPHGWTITLTDFSPGMVAATRRSLGGDPRFRFETAEATRLPAAAASQDAVIAHHMLYHVPDRAKALVEFRRILKPGGLLSVALNGRAHLRELIALANHLPGVTVAVASPGDAFDLEDAPPEIAGLFEAPVTLCYDDALHVTESAPLAAYFASDFRFTVTDRAQLEAALQSRIAHDGAIHIGKASGLIHARVPAA